MLISFPVRHSTSKTGKSSNTHHGACHRLQKDQDRRPVFKPILRGKEEGMRDSAMRQNMPFQRSSSVLEHSAREGPRLKSINSVGREPFSLKQTTSISSYVRRESRCSKESPRSPDKIAWQAKSKPSHWSALVQIRRHSPFVPTNDGRIGTPVMSPSFPLDGVDKKANPDFLSGSTTNPGLAPDRQEIVQIPICIWPWIHTGDGSGTVSADTRSSDCCRLISRIWSLCLYATTAVAKVEAGHGTTARMPA